MLWYYFYNFVTRILVARTEWYQLDMQSFLYYYVYLIFNAIYIFRHYYVYGRVNFNTIARHGLLDPGSDEESNQEEDNSRKPEARVNFDVIARHGLLDPSSDEESNQEELSTW